MTNFKKDIGGKDFTIEIKSLADQANGNLLVRYGDTVVLATCVMSKEPKEGLGFFPLSVEYEERFYAAGKIKGARYIRRESRPSDEAILTSRMIDRIIRPRFPKHFKREVQVILTCLSWDAENDPDVVGIIAASAALSVSDIPWLGPIAAVRVGKIDNNFIINPTYLEREKSEIDIVFGALIDEKGDIVINMIDGFSKEVDENTVLSAFSFAKKHLIEICEFQKEVASKIGKEKLILDDPVKDEELEKEIKDFIGNKIEDALYQKEKAKRSEQMDSVKKEILNFVEEKYADSSKIAYVKDFFDEEVCQIIHKNIIEQNKRPDARKPDELRQISGEVGLLPRTHGSSLFTRGETRTLSILTLGAPGDQQLLEGMEISGRKRFMHHYNFPPYSTGEVKPLRGPGRREIGHGALAEKALAPVIPSLEDFPYTIRVVSEILSSNGSTSMAAASSASLALMDAGVPISKPVTGIALGLMSNDKGEYKVLTDIQGPEDYHGDMDLKVAGTDSGITVIQMDVKIKGITEEVFQKALEQAKKARLEILENIAKVLKAPRESLSPFAPRILTMQINPEKIREVIGPGGKMINEITKDCNVTIDIEESGLIFITSDSQESAQKAALWIKNITREVQSGEIFQGKVKRILDFGCFVEILPGQEGLVHISQLAPYRVNKVEDVVKVGDTVTVKVINIDEQGRINLSLKDAKENTQATEKK